MCSILGIIQRESVLPKDLLKKVFKVLERRGSDGFGVEIYDLCTHKIVYSYKSILPPSRDSFAFLEYQMAPNRLLLANLRAQPETEVGSSLQNLQPITKKKCVVVHNGSIDAGIYSQYIKEPKVTEIDSEAIIDGYLYYDKDMHEFMEHSIGGHAVLLYDIEGQNLFTITDFKPLYFTRFGDGEWIFSSLEEVNQIMLEDYDLEAQVGRQEGFTIREIGLNSKLSNNLLNFTPRYRHPTYDPHIAKKDLYIVLASGGIDSGLTAWTLGCLGYDVMLLHFDYGQKGEHAESRGMAMLYDQMLTKGMRVLHKYFNLETLYNNEPSQLVDPNLEVTTGTQDIKSTIAWVSSRNLLFSSYAITIAEQNILRNEYKNVYISAGFFNLTESGIYPDNSEYFGIALNEVIKFGTICASRIQFVPLYANVMKSEEWVLGHALGFPFEATVSCDEPIIKNGEIYLCDNCGSTKLSHWAAMMVGIPDPRKFYHIDSKQSFYDARIEFNQKKVSVSDVIDKLYLSNSDKRKLKQIIGEKKYE